MTPFEIADAFRACLVTAFEEDEGAPAEICHRPGGEAPLSFGLSQDECCSGLAWVRIAGIDPVQDPLGFEEPGASPCDVFRKRVTLELGVARCNPFGTAAKGPDCGAWTELALRMDLDASAMRRAVCCFSQLPNVGPGEQIPGVRGGAWEPLEASGLCAGGIMTVAVWMECSEC
ncbi:MAG TPA: hypothetical protein VFX97_20610 [Pyrinomonadaceae bacterium]|nr:hypothetical protein [Pyrinomonadaceae bacterium]